MKTFSNVLRYFQPIIFFFILIQNAQFLQAKQNQQSLKLIQTIQMPGVRGRIDHMILDETANRLFVAALGNNSVEVVDLSKGKVIHSIKGLQEPQGVIFVKENNSLFVSCAGDGLLKIFDTKYYKLKGEINLGNDADNMRYDRVAQKIYVGYGDGAIAIIDALTGKILAHIPLDGHPEAFEQSADGVIYVNVPDAKEIEMISLKKLQVEKKIKLKKVEANFPLALDKENNRLFVGCRRPPKMIVYDAKNLTEKAQFEIMNDADDFYFDNASKRIFISGGAGYIEIFNQVSSDKYFLQDKIFTSPGARTSLLSADLKKIFLAAPKTNFHDAEILIYKIE
ncbi:MAG: YncE family protein [Ignavibacteriaceae bacterium]